MKKMMELDVPEEGCSRELFRGFNAQEIVVTLNSRGEVRIILYDQDNTELKPHSHLVLGMQSPFDAPPSSEDGGKKYGCFYCFFIDCADVPCARCISDYDEGKGWTYWRFKDNPRKPLSEVEGGEPHG